jgi:hypothetical protein
VDTLQTSSMSQSLELGACDNLSHTQVKHTAVAGVWALGMYLHTLQAACATADEEKGAFFLANCVSATV